MRTIDNGRATRSRLFIRTLIPLAVEMLVPLFILGITIGLLMNRYMAIQIDEKNKNRVENYAQYLDSELNQIELININLSSNSTVRQRLKTIFQNLDDEISSYQYDTIDTVSSLLYSSVKSSPFIESAYIYLNNNKGWFLSSTDWIGNLSSSTDVHWYDSYKARIEEGKSDMWEERRTLRNGQLFSVFCPIISSVSQKSEGVIVLNINDRAMHDQCALFVDGTDDVLEVVDADGDILFASSSDVKERDSFKCYQKVSSEYVWTYRLLCSSQEMKLLNAKITKITILMVLIASCIALCISYLVAKRDFRELQDLNTSLKLKKPFHKDKNSYRTNLYADVVKEMVDSFVKVNTLSQQLEQKKFQAKTLELQTLSTQFTPHFLYNTLQAISWKTIALTGAPNDASAMIDNLSQLLRYVLNDIGSFAPLKEEIAVTKAYLAIQEMRFGNDFTIIWDITDVDGNLPVPKLIIQPIVENAISHGLRGKKGNKRLTLRIFGFVGKCVKFQIIDNGEGMTPAKLTEVRTQMKQVSAPTTLHDCEKDRLHVGMASVSKRLLLLYQPSEQLSVVSQSGKGTCVTFHIPLDA